MFTRTKMDWRLSLLFLATMGRIEASENGEVRGKRQALYPPPLVYPLGGVLKLVVGFAMPVQVSGQILSYGQNIQFQYMLPNNATFFTNYFEDSSRRRRRRRVSWSERVPVYDVLQRELDMRNVDGRACLKKNICEAASTSLKDEGLVGELLHLLLTPGEGDAFTMDYEYLEAATLGRGGKNCSMIYPTCPPGQGILDRISTIY
ncbi:uncharacterized protein LOC100864219 [Apis florea]|uniref:uncharacterized protein LOC100864219 n=1 Tax=Apis florea TaxID=7463 RepID=UPI00062972A4|nr:uncharacterized protein LOC100864219 [Apis florea]